MQIGSTGKDVSMWLISYKDKDMSSNFVPDIKT